MYDLHRQEQPEENPEPDLGDGQGELEGSRERYAGDGNTDGNRGLDWTVGHFAVFALPASSPVPLLVGEIRDKPEKGTEGEEVLIHWYSPARRQRGNLPSEYGKGKWSPDFEKGANGKLVEMMDKELTAAACTTFPSLRQDGLLPQYVWGVVAEQVAPP